MEILLWLAPPALVTVAAMAWAGWVGRDGHGAVDRDVAVQRLAAAMERTPPRVGAPTARPASREREDRSTGVAVRPSRRAS